MATTSHSPSSWPRGVHASDTPLRTLPAPMIGAPLRRYFNEHVRAAKYEDIPPGYNNLAARADRDPFSMYVVTTPLHAFKLAWAQGKDKRFTAQRAIVNLIIPVGAVVYAAPDAFYVPQWPDDSPHHFPTRKMRASNARVHSVFTAEGKEIEVAHSHHNPLFEYRKGKLMKPKCQFDWSPKVCASGIHFFLNVADAYSYDWR